MTNILVIEDDKFFARIVKDLILGNAEKKERNKDSLHFDHAENAIIALEMMKTKRYQLVITDIMMAKCSGWDFIKEVRKDYTRSELPIIVVSAVKSADMQYEAVSKGATDGFAKPMNGEEMRRFVNVVFNLIAEHTLA